MIRETVTKKPCHFELDLPEEGVEVMADPEGITQVFANILSNAVKYCEPECHVDIHLRCEDNVAVVGFRDRGLGIAPDLLPMCLICLFNRIAPKADWGRGFR